MKTIKYALWIIVILIVLGSSGFTLVKYYSYIFSKVVRGKVMRVERVIDPTAIMTTNGGGLPNSQLFSFAVEIQQDGTGEVFTSSSEDRQWAVIQKDQCVEAKFFKYPPWNLEKGGTYFNARLMHVFQCP